MQKWSQRRSLKNKNKEQSQFAKTFWRGKMSFWAMSSQVMKHGSTNMTLKRSGKMHNGRMSIPHGQKNCRSKSRVKTMLLTFFDIRGIVHYEFVSTGQTVNQVYYLEVMETLHEKLDRNDPNFLTTHRSCITTMHLLTQHCL